jgi:hypothetical protein
MEPIVDGERISQVSITNGGVFRLAHSGPQIQIRLELDAEAPIGKRKEINQTQSNLPIPQIQPNPVTID